MKKTLIALAAAHLVAAAASALPRQRTLDISYGFRMPAGFPGDPNRTHPFSVVPGLMTPTLASKVRLYGDPVLIDPATNSYRGFLAGDTAVTKIDGVLVRPYPTQQTTGGMNSAIGAAVPPDGPAVIDVLNEGFIIVRCNNFATQQPRKGDPVYVRVAATAGALVQGGFSSAADGANTVLVTNAKWNGPTDSAGVTEIQVAAPLA
jgi:hypothetical protein